MAPSPAPARWDALAADFEVAWRKAQAGNAPQPNVADFLLRTGDRTAALVELLHYDIEYRLLTNATLTFDDYLIRFPELSEVPVDVAELRRHETTCRGRLVAKHNLHLKPGAQVGHYLIQELVASGGMGDVYRALDTAIQRPVAVKVLQTKYLADAAMAARFVEEAQITGQLQHPGIPPIYQVGTLPDGRPYLAMKLIAGQTLQQLIESGAAINRLAVFEAVAQAVGYAHEHGIIHRDLKPQNIMVGSFGEVQVMDWGLAKRLSDSNPDTLRGTSTTADTIASARADRDTPATKTGTVLGTPAYMAPEQTENRADRRSDVYGLGAVLHAMLTGRPPGDEELLGRCESEADIVDLCRQCLATNPTDRLANANAVATEVARIHAEAQQRVKDAEVAKTRAQVETASLRRQRRTLLFGGAVIGTVLTIGIAGTAWGLSRAREAEATAEQRADREEAAKRTKSKVLDFVMRSFRKVDPSALGDEVRVIDVLSQAKDEVQGIDDLESRAEVLAAIGSALSSIGLHVKAEETFQAAYETASNAFGFDDPRTIRYELLVAAQHGERGDCSLALPALHRLLVVLGEQRATRHDPDVIKISARLITCLANSSNPQEALTRAVKLESCCRDIYGEQHALTRLAVNTHAHALMCVGDRRGALGLPHIARTLRCIVSEGHVADSLILDETNLETIVCIRNILFHEEDHAELQRVDRCLERIRSSKQSKANPQYLIWEHTKLMSVAPGQNALELTRDMLPRLIATFGPAHHYPMMAMHNMVHLVINPIENLTKPLTAEESAQNRLDAVKFAEANLRWSRSHRGPTNFWTQISLRYLAIAYMNTGREVDALPLLQEAHLLQLQNAGPHDLQTAQAQQLLAQCLLDLKRWSEAEMYLKSALATLIANRETKPELAIEVAWVRCQWGLALLKTNRVLHSVNELDRGIRELEHVPEANRTIARQRSDRLERARGWQLAAKGHWDDQKKQFIRDLKNVCQPQIP